MRSILVTLGLALLLAHPSRAGAQWPAPVGVQIDRAADGAASGPSASPTREPSASNYVRRGALLGAIALGAGAVVAVASQGGECLGCSPIIVAPVVLGTGALLGATVGYVVYRIRRSRPTAQRSSQLTGVAGLIGARPASPSGSPPAS